MPVSAASRSRRAMLAAGLVLGLVAGSAGAAVAHADGHDPAGARVLGAGQTGSRSRVPWSKIGPGWALALYSASSGGEGRKPKTGPATLYLVDPQGGRYTLAHWPAHSAQARWTLQAWSGDAKRAVFTSGAFGTRQQVHQLQLATGRVTSFPLPLTVSALGYTRPDGRNLLASKEAAGSVDPKISFERYDLTGHLQKVLTSARGLTSVAYQPNGLTLAIGTVTGLELVSNAGGVIRRLPVPKTKFGCEPMRWWSAGSILASCTSTSVEPRLWLVPASGSAPSPLTPQRGPRNPDQGDFNAWRLSSGLYLDALGACGTVVIAQQLANGSARIISVPGSTAGSNLIVTATRSQLLVERLGACQDHNSLVWFNPVTRSVKVAVPAGSGFGVTSVEPYFVAGER